LCLAHDAIEKGSCIICEHVIGLLKDHTTILIYASKHPEVETRNLIAQLIATGKRVVVPIIEKETRSLRLSYLVNPATLVKSTFNVPEPVGNEIPARPKDIEVAIIPMIAFDAKGSRLGYGAGYYDRFLKKNPHIIKIGISFSCQEEVFIPSDSNDIQMDYIVTERGVITCHSSKN